jgi:hypothetical protein
MPVPTPETRTPVPAAQDDLSSAARTSADPDPVDLDSAPDPFEGFVRIPGFLQRWEIPQVVKADAEFRIEEAGTMMDDTPLFVVHRRDPQPAGAVDVGVPVAVTFESGQTLGARMLPIGGGDPLMTVLVLGDNPDDASALARVREHLARSGHKASGAAGGPAAMVTSPKGAP